MNKPHCLLQVGLQDLSDAEATAVICQAWIHS